MKNAINKIDIQNEDLLEILDRVKDVVNDPDFQKIRVLNKDKVADDWVSDEYLATIKNMGPNHEGYPVALQGIPCNSDYMQTTVDDPDIMVKFIEMYDDLNAELMTWLGTRNNALWCVYPPNGFISWHNNANAYAYNIILTWSENGDGYWEHIEPKTGERVRIQDQKGWNAKAGYFGNYNDYEAGDDRLVYHKAQNFSGWRMTLGFMFNNDERGKMMWEAAIEDIQSP